MKLLTAATPVLACAFCIAASTPARADTAVARADDHAPIGVMGDHRHHAGEWMFSYRYMHMDMTGNRDGKDAISPDQIATTAANPFAGMPGMPPTLRVVPLDMQMDMHMFGMMYAPTDRITLMGMVSYVDQRMKHQTYAGASGTTVLGEFTTHSNGLADSQLSALIGLGENSAGRWHAIAGLSLPTGSIDRADTVLAPNNMRPSLRLPYPMQLGSGTVDPILGMVVTHKLDQWSYGAQWKSTWRVSDNDEDYRLGNRHELSAWISRLWSPTVSTSFRLDGIDQGAIRGRDIAIMAPVQTADPQRQGGQRIDAAIGLNLAGHGPLAGQRIGFELQKPIYQRLRGPQLETDWLLTAGYQYAF
jgi:hypothetical protein